MKKLFFTFLCGSTIAFGCNFQPRQKSVREIEANAQEIIEKQLLEDGDSTATVTDFYIGRATEYTYEGSFSLNKENEDPKRYTMIVYYDYHDKDGGVMVRWKPTNAFSDF